MRLSFRGLQGSHGKGPQARFPSAVVVEILYDSSGPIITYFFQCPRKIGSRVSIAWLCGYFPYRIERDTIVPSALPACTSVDVSADIPIGFRGCSPAATSATLPAAGFARACKGAYFAAAKCSSGQVS